LITFHLSTRSNVPPYVQLVEQVRQALLNETLRPGDRMPTIKDVVGSLAINPNTVLKAYRDLEREGLVEGRQGVGTFVLRRPDGPPPNEQAALERALASWITRAQRAGLADGDIESMVRTVLRSLSAATSGEAIA
jgi:DNA-binding transcriptional regulator YhcF (GntR family)